MYTGKGKFQVSDSDIGKVILKIINMSVSITPAN